jgi:indole-3-glycerol phosphate synthase
MTHILDTIVRHKRSELAALREARPVEMLESSPGFSRKCVSLAASVRDSRTTGIIAEFKRRSPSRGAIHESADVTEVTRGYARYGASGLSVLTDAHFFGGSTTDLETARSVNRIPILRKDFVVDPYQVYETKAMGADVMLLISECLSAREVRSLAALARELGLEVLLEMHTERELDKLCPEITMVGINNRDLKTFRVDIERSIQLAEKLPLSLPRIAESGIGDPGVLMRMREAGFDGFLMGEHFMKQQKPQEAFRDFVARIMPRTASPRLKVCGMTDADEMRLAAGMGAHYVGMIFYGPSPRFCEDRLCGDEVRKLENVSRVGVFVNATPDDILDRVERYGLDMVQLHGEESPELCRALRARIPVIKAFRIRSTEDLATAEAYSEVADYFLFDTPGSLYGGNGSRFDWSLLEAYRGNVPFFLSGGIGPDSVAALKAFSHPLFFGIDINSRFETRPGIKNMEEIKRFIWDLNII